MVNGDHYWTLDEVAEHYAVSRRTIARQVDTGEIPVVRVGRSVRVPNQFVAKLDLGSGHTAGTCGCPCHGHDDGTAGVS